MKPLFEISIEVNPLSPSGESARLHFLTATDKKQKGLYAEALENACQAQRLLGTDIWSWGIHRITMVATLLQMAVGLDAAIAEFERLLQEGKICRRGNWVGMRRSILYQQGVVQRRAAKTDRLIEANTV